MEEGLPTLPPGFKIKNRYEVIKKLGEGGFGAVYSVKDNMTSQLYAMKVEGVSEPIQVLKMEVVVLQELAKKGGKHVCNIEDRGRNDVFNYVIMSLLGQSLQDLKKACPGGKFSPGSAIRTGMQCLQAVADLHEIGFLHRDLKPGNYAIGREALQLHRTVFILDFGLARKYINARGEIRTPRSAAGFRGTVKYAPLNCHRSKELSRKDDLETWFYQQVELTAGVLPWSGAADKDDVMRAKERTRQNGQLFEKCPSCYSQILRYIDGLQYWDKPDYNSIQQQLYTVLQQLKVTMQDPYDWEKGGQHFGLTSRLPPPQFKPHADAPWINF